MPERQSFYSPEQTTQVSSTKPKVPIQALQMLTQSVSHYARDYIQPLPVTTEEQKKSPLALLAATCSSIGKNETHKDHEHERIKSDSPVSSKEETKSSFKPYKQPDNPSDSKAGFRVLPNKSPVLVGGEHSASFLGKEGSGPYQYHLPCLDSNGLSYLHSQGRLCGMMYGDYSQHGNASIHPALHKECTGSCCASATILPYKPNLPQMGSALANPPAALKTPSLPTSIATLSPLYPHCGCGYCSQLGSDTSAHLPSHHSTTGKTPVHPMSTSMYPDYLQSSSSLCRDPHCTNCKPRNIHSMYSHCGPQCLSQSCSIPHGELKTDSHPGIPQATHLYPHGFLLKNPQDEINPYVCNWVADSKSCGKSFPSSEELLQHLRTHTTGSAAANASQTTCNIHGCPCKLQSPRSYSLTSARFHPYYSYKHASSLPTNPAAFYPSYPVHGLSSYGHPGRLFSK